MSICDYSLETAYYFISSEHMGIKVVMEASSCNTPEPISIDLPTLPEV